MSYSFHHGSDLLALCRRDGISLGEAMLRREIEEGSRTRPEIFAEMQRNLDVMRASIAAGLDPAQPTHGLLAGNESVKLDRYAAQSELGPRLCRMVAAGMAVAEVNASMGQIVAAPTAGASGILPAVVVCCGDERGLADEALCMALFAAGAVGAIVAENASIAGASGGCQAETGTAAAMAAAALAQMKGAAPEVSLTAAAIALKNCMGLVCDPVGGLVECPCIKRNAIGVANAVLSCDLAMAGIPSLIPFDEVVDAMRAVGAVMSPDLKETARGGLAATETARRLTICLKS